MKAIKKITPVTIDGDTYHYRVAGILYAQTYEAAQAGRQALLDMPEDLRQLLKKDAKHGLFLAFLERPSVDESAYAVWGTPKGLTKDLQQGKVRIDGRPPNIRQMCDGFIIKVGTGNRSRAFVNGAFSHEADHQFRFRSGHAAYIKEAESNPSKHIRATVEDWADPTFLTGQRKTFQYSHFQDMTNYMRRHNIQSIREIKEGPANYLFKKPMVYYFYPEIQYQMNERLKFHGIELPNEVFERTMQRVEQHWYCGEQPISTLTANLHEIAPTLSFTDIRQIISRASLFVRQELSAHHTEASQLFGKQQVQQIAPNFSKVMEKITAPRRALLGLNSTATESVITLDATPKAAFSASKFVRPALGAVNVVTSTIQAGGDPVAGVVGAVSGIRTAAAISILAQTVTPTSAVLPMFGVLGMLPDAREEYYQTLQGLQQEQLPPPPVHTPVEEALNNLTYGNPWGPGQGLVSGENDFKTIVKTLNKIDPAKMEAYPQQKAGQVFNKVVDGVVRVSIGLAKAIIPINPFSCSTLHAPDVYRDLPPQLPPPPPPPPASFAPPFLADIKQPFSIYNNHCRPNGVPLNDVPNMTMSSEQVALFEEEQKTTEKEAAPAVSNYSGNPSRVKEFTVPLINYNESKIPEWVQGIGIVGSLGTGWKAYVVTQLTWASFGAGLALLAVTEIICHFINKHEASKQRRNARNERRVGKQCEVIYNDMQRTTHLLDQAIALANQYLAETDPVKKAAYFDQFRQKVNEANTVNEQQKSINEIRINDKNQRVDGHKIRRRTRRYCASVHGMFADNSRLLTEMDDLIIMGLSYSELQQRLATENNPGKSAAIKSLIGVADAKAAQEAEQRRQQAIAISNDNIQKALDQHNFIEATKLCNESQMDEATKVDTCKFIILKENEFKDAEYNGVLEEIDEALRENDFEKAKRICEESKILDEDKEDQAEILEDIATEQKRYLDTRFTNKLKLANEGLNVVNHLMTFMLPSNASPVGASIAMTDNQGVQPVNCMAWKQAKINVSVTQVGKFKPVTQVSETLQSNKKKTNAITKLKL